MPTETQHETVVERIAGHLGRQIITGVYSPGQKLKELDIAHELSVSSNTVRESFHILEKRHLIIIEPRRGAFVSDITPEQITALYDFMYTLFGALAGPAAEQWRENDLKDFVALLTRMQKYMQEQNVPDFHGAAFEFITAGLRFTKNIYLHKALTDLLPQLQRCSYLALQTRTNEISAAYTLFSRIMETMLQRDPIGTTSAVHAYCRHQCSIVLDAISTP